MDKETDLTEQMQTIGILCSEQNVPFSSTFSLQSSSSTLGFSMYGDFTPITVSSRSIPINAHLE